MKEDLLQCLNMANPVLHQYTEDVYACATILDPQFKTAFFSCSEAKDDAVKVPRQRFTEMTVDNTDETAPPMKKLHQNQVDKAYCNPDDVAKDYNCRNIQQTSLLSNVKVRAYLSELKVTADTDAFEWCRHNATCLS
jgi:hypothetical protein